jgi:hypothetical protein
VPEAKELKILRIQPKERGKSPRIQPKERSKLEER